MKIFLVIFALFMCVICFGNAATTKGDNVRCVAFNAMSAIFFGFVVAIWVLL